MSDLFTENDEKLHFQRLTGVGIELKVELFFPKDLVSEWCCPLAELPQFIPLSSRLQAHSNTLRSIEFQYTSNQLYLSLCFGRYEISPARCNRVPSSNWTDHFKDSTPIWSFGSQSLRSHYFPMIYIVDTILVLLQNILNHSSTLQSIAIARF